MEKIFISHISEEAKIAIALKDWIESSFLGQCHVFVSSDKDDIPAGIKWFDQINSALEEASVLIVLCSPASLSRPWINFETGCGWIKGVPIIPICHSGQHKGSLPPPISMFQAVDVRESDFVDSFLSGLAKPLGVDRLPRIDKEAMRREILESCGQSSAAEPSEEQEEITSDSDLSSECIEILKLLGQHSEDRPTAGDLASYLRMSEQKTQYFLDRLTDAKLIYRANYVGSPSTYSLNKEGRKYLFEKDML